MSNVGSILMSGELVARYSRGEVRKRGLRNLKPLMWRGLLKMITKVLHYCRLPFVTFWSDLSVRKWDSQKDLWLDYGLVSCRVITNAGVAFLVDDWNNDATDITTMNYHDSGTGTVAEAVTDTGLGTPCGEARDAGTKSKPTANQLRTVATHTYAGSFAITEHGIFSATTAGTLWDRSVFAAINVVANDKIEFTYTCTVNAGG
jgi:hypothetical protein